MKIEDHPETAFLIHFFAIHRCHALSALAPVYDYRIRREERPKPLVFVSIFHSKKIGNCGR